MPDKSVALWLADATNEFQQMLKVDAEAACRKANLGFEVYFTGYELATQVSRIRAAIAGGSRASVYLVLATLDRGLARYVRDAARAGISWIYLNRSEDDLDAIKRECPGVAIATVSADERETGRIQGRQFRAMLPSGQRVLYVQGGTRSLVARERTAGVLEATRGAPFEVSLLEGGWDPPGAKQAMRRWLTIVAPGRLAIDLVGCQNDPLAVAARDALREVSESLGRPELARIPLTGCDGTPGVGQRLVREGTLRATVALPLWSGLAVQMAARFLQKGEIPPSLTLVKPSSFPPEAALRPVEAKAS
jgi:ABC-type sugar transport system substrate-binding protein